MTLTTSIKTVVLLTALGNLIPVNQARPVLQPQGLIHKSVNPIPIDGTLAMANIWRCLECGAEYSQHFAWCSGCLGSGQIVPKPTRSYAVLDSTPVLTNAREMAAMTWGFVEHTAYPSLRIGKRAFVLYVGGPGDGKSSAATILANSINGPILYVSSEEQAGPTVAERLGRCGVRRETFHITHHGSVDQIADYVRQLKIVCVVFDSVTVIMWTAEELRHFLAMLPTLEAMICTVQVTKAGLPAGSNSLIHEADIVIRVASMKWTLEKSRYQPLDSASGDVLAGEIPPRTLALVPPEKS